MKFKLFNFLIFVCLLSLLVSVFLKAHLVDSKIRKYASPTYTGFGIRAFGTISILDASNRKIRPGDIAKMAKIAPKTTFLRLSRTGVSDAQLDELSHFPNLLGVDLTVSKVSANGFISLSKIPKLKLLLLDSKALTAEELEKIKLNLQKVKVVEMDKTKVPGTVFENDQ